MEERKNDKKRRPQQLVEMWPRTGQGIRHNPQSAFWELMLGVTAWSAQPLKRAKGHVGNLSHQLHPKVTIAGSECLFPDSQKTYIHLQ